MTKNKGYTLIELIMFIVALSIASATILITIAFSLKHTPIEHNQTIAIANSSKCMEYFLGQRYVNGFEFNSQVCPGGSIDTTVPSFCNNLTPDGFTISVKIECATANSEPAFKLITVTTTETNGPSKSILKLLIADYEHEISN